MSENRSEMVTIEIPVAWAEKVVGEWGQGSETSGVVYLACKQVLDARKTELEKWRESDGLGLPWVLDGHTVVFNEDRGYVTFRQGSFEKAQLMVAAPLLLEALLDAWKRRGLRNDWRDAIKAALPEPVWREVLGED